MKNLKVSAKLMVSFLVLLALMLVVGGIGIVSSSMFINNIDALHKLNNENAGIITVVQAHYEWRHNLTVAVMCGEEFTGSLDPNGCALGSWLLSDVAKQVDDPEILQLLADVKVPHEYIHTNARGVMELVEAGNQGMAIERLCEDIFPKTTEVIDLLNKSQDRYERLIEELDNEIEALSMMVIVITAAALAVSVVAVIFLTIYVSGLISKPLNTITAFMEKAGQTGDIALRPEDVENIGRLSKIKDEIGHLTIAAAAFVKHVIGISERLDAIAHGDLTVKVDRLSENDTMGNALEYMIDNLNSMFAEIQASTAQVSTGSKQIADGAQTLAQGSTEQAASIQELSNSISEIAGKTKDNAMTAGKTSKLSETIKDNAEKGSRQMDEMIVAVKDINDASQSISKIIKTIDDIAFQTNILALNAAVEAARAGQHGKGFAVVAEEVRNMASKSAEAAKDTGDMIQNSMEKAELGSRIAEETSKSLNEIVSGINESSGLIEEITKSSEEQSRGIAHINTGIDQVAQVVQQNSATAEESAAASEEMSGQSDMLQQLIGQFKLKGGAGGYRSLPTGGSSEIRQGGAPKKDVAGYDGADSGDFGKY